MIPAHAVPWPTTSFGWRGHDLPVVADPLDRDALDEPSADGRVVALDPGVHDRDAHAPPCPVAERPPAVHAAPRPAAAQPVAVRLARTARSTPARSRLTGGTSAAWCGPTGARAPRGSRSRAPPGRARHGRARATASARAHRRPPASSSSCRASVGHGGSQRLVRGAIRRPPRSRGRPSAWRRSPARVALHAAGTDRDRGLAREHGGKVEVAQLVRTLAAAVEDLEDADAPRRRRAPAPRGSSGGT